MRRDGRSNEARAAAAGAALAMALSIGALLHQLFAPAITSFGEQVPTASRAGGVTEVVIVPARIEVVVRRPHEFAENDPQSPVRGPGS